MEAADLLNRVLIVIIVLAARFYILKKVGLRFRRHVIHTQAKAKGCVRPSIRPGTSLGG